MNPDETITDKELENLDQLYEIKIDSDEDYQKLGELFDEDE